MSIESLVAKAKQAEPPSKPGCANWRKFHPVIDTLMQGGHNLSQALDWLISEKAIKADDKRKAYRSLLHRYGKQKEVA